MLKFIAFFGIILLWSCRSKQESKLPSWHDRFADASVITRMFPDSAGAYRTSTTDLKYIEIREGETVADIGSYGGLRIVLYSLRTDSVNYVIQDIDSSGFKYLDFIKTHFSSFDKSARKDRFSFVKGTDTTTGLPAATVDRMVIIDSFHHFSRPSDMLADIRKALKPGGRLYIGDIVERKRTHTEGECIHYSRKDFFRMLEKAGFVLEREGHLYGPFTMFVFRLS